MITYSLHVSHSEMFTAYYVARTDSRHPDDWEYVRSLVNQGRKGNYYYWQRVVERANRMSAMLARKA